MNGRKLIIEGIVIVVSILLAFAIDAWWDERRERIEEREAMVSLRSDFETNLAEIKQVMDLHVRARNIVDEMVGATDEEIIASTQKQRSEYVTNLCNPWSFHPVLGSLQALIGAGKLEILEDRRLREALTTFLFLVEDSYEDVGYVGSDAQRVWVAEVELGGPWTDREVEQGSSGNVVKAPIYIAKATVDDILRIRNDARIVGLIGRCHLNVGYYLDELISLQESAEYVLELIESSGHIGPG